MARVVLEPDYLEFLFFREQYVALVADLERQGFDVDLVQPVPAGPGIDPLYPDPATVLNVAVQVVDLGGKLASIGVVTAQLVKHLRGRGRPRRRAHLYLPDGSKHEFELSEEVESQ